VREDYTVELEAVFRGPMDLLLHLVKEQEVEIQEVEISRVIDGYFRYLDTLHELDLEVAGDFLVLAATLMSIKARSLLPREEVELGGELDPEDELIQRLIEYRRFKEASEDLESRWTSRAERRERGWHGDLDESAGERTIEIGELTTWDLLAAFSRLMRETLANRPHRVRGERRPLRWYVHEVGRILGETRTIPLSDLLAHLGDAPCKEDLIGAFCALLELMKLGVVSARQDGLHAEIIVELCEAAVGTDIDDMIGAATFMDEEILLPEDPAAPGAESLDPTIEAADAPEMLDELASEALPDSGPEAETDDWDPLG
jgi:segregation and condensation protein A